MKPSYGPVGRGFCVRLMSPLGSYPATDIVTESSALIVTPDICFSIVRVKKNDWGFSEVDGLAPVEIPLLESIILAGDGEDRCVYPYPSAQAVTLETTIGDEIDDKCVSECRVFLLDQLKKSEFGKLPVNLPHKPPALGGAPYDLVPSQHSNRERYTVLRQMETAGPVVLRGVRSLIKAHMAWRHPELGEAGCIYLWICLDAAHSIILQRLREGGIANPTSADAARYFDKISGYNTEWEKFFEDDYQNRIRTIHPENRFGAEVRPQLEADDFLELNDMLIPLFQFLVENPADAPSGI